MLGQAHGCLELALLVRGNYLRAVESPPVANSPSVKLLDAHAARPLSAIFIANPPLAGFANAATMTMPRNSITRKHGNSNTYLPIS
jgi:hypothetical protein